MSTEPPAPRPASDELVIAMTPRQLLGGFVLLAAFVLFVLRRRRRGSRP